LPNQAISLLLKQVGWLPADDRQCGVFPIHKTVNTVLRLEDRQPRHGHPAQNHHFRPQAIPSRRLVVKPATSRGTLKRMLFLAMKSTQITQGSPNN